MGMSGKKLALSLPGTRTTSSCFEEDQLPWNGPDYLEDIILLALKKKCSHIKICKQQEPTIKNVSLNRKEHDWLKLNLLCCLAQGKKIWTTICILYMCVWLRHLHLCQNAFVFLWDFLFLYQESSICVLRHSLDGNFSYYWMIIFCPYFNLQ